MSRQSQERRRRRQKLKAKAARTKRHEANRAKNELRRIERYGRAISRRQFDAYCYCRMPLVRFLAREVEWYSLFGGRLLAAVFEDVTDNDYGFVILGRDARRLFRAIDVSPAPFRSSAPLAREALAEHLAACVGNVQDVYPQGDEVEPVISLFTDHIEPAQQHPNFRVLKNEPRYEGARNLISEIANSFVDKDGHFELEFQSQNFHARLWELYLHIYLHNAGFTLEHAKAAPDFCAVHAKTQVFIEAVTVNPSGSAHRPDLPAPETREEIHARLDDFMPIKFGSALYSKLSKRYWEAEHVRGHPLVLAIHDYHNQNAMTWSRTALSEYLYGVRTRLVDGQVIVSEIEAHEWEGKRIPTNFFALPEAENISAVLFSNQATIPKFNRMGKIGGLGSADVKMIRQGLLYNPKPGAIYPIPFAKDLDDPDYEESWSDGLIMFHNPRAKHPVDPEVFADISHIWYSEEKGFTGFHQPYDVLGSMTIVITTRGKIIDKGEDESSPA